MSHIGLKNVPNCPLYISLPNCPIASNAALPRWTVRCISLEG